MVSDDGSFMSKILHHIRKSRVHDNGFIKVLRGGRGIKTKYIIILNILYGKWHVPKIQECRLHMYMHLPFWLK